MKGGEPMPAKDEMKTLLKLEGTGMLQGFINILIQEDHNAGI